MRRLIAPLALACALLLAGCTQSASEPERPSEPLPLLEEYEGCPWAYPDNTSHGCDSPAVAPTLDAEIPTGWVCTEENREQGWSFHWDPVTEERGIYYELPPEVAGKTGLMRLTTAGEDHLLQWEEAPEQGFIRVPVEVGDNVSFRYEVHEFGYATNGTLNEAQGEAVWSLFDRQFWVIHRFETGNGTYAFQNMTTQKFRVDNNDPERDDEIFFYHVNPFNITGEDFDLWVHHERHHMASSLIAVPTTGVDRFCMTGLGDQAILR